MKPPPSKDGGGFFLCDDSVGKMLLDNAAIFRAIATMLFILKS